MALIVVRHDTGRPGLYGAAAGIVAAQCGARVMHGPVRLDEVRDPDACQHVGTGPDRVASGLLHAERLTGRLVDAIATPAQIVAAAATDDVVVPLDRLLDAGTGFVTDLLRRGAAVGLRRVSAYQDGAVLMCRDDGDGTVVAHAVRDGFGRFLPETHGAGGAEAGRVSVVLIGRPVTHHEVYPGALAALGDAADALGIGVDVTFVDPAAADDDPCYTVLTDFDGMLLPGGAAAPGARGQVRAATVALESGVPVMGQCLGMQTMVTAFARSRAGLPDATMAEIAGGAAGLHSFIPHPHYRLGTGKLSPVPDTVLGAMLVDGAACVRSNHRYVLNTRLLPGLVAAGLRVGAWNDDADVVEGIEVPSHPFYMGMQGHPELSSIPGSPHPLCVAFLRAALTRRDGRAEAENRKER